HLIICREYPPAPSGGIGTYALHVSRLLAAAGETVHVIGQMWEGADAKIEEQCNGRLIVHRVPFDDWASWLPRQPHPELNTKEQRSLFNSGFAPQCFSWEAALLAERIVKNEGIDIIEGPDYEAPLYYFQLRRALGLGPKRRPTCFVHLHSPTEFIARHNDWDMSQPGVLTAKRLENYSIAAADALVCPSRYLARQAETHYGLAKDAIPIIPYPIGESRIIKREESTWESGTICYVGRLERRKGVTEWIEAAVSVAAEYPTARFEFVGADTFDANGASIRELGESKIPKDLKARFCFRGERKRSSLAKFLARARIAVGPSRWENFPNTCLEAMGSGLPVIASRDGGMMEMIEDGRTGWLATNPRSEGLAEALKRALETPATRVAEMGRHAASDIRFICDNSRIVEKHIEFRSNISQQGAKRSLHLPVSLPWIKRPFLDEPLRRTQRDNTSKGLAVVVTCSNSGQFLDECLQSLKRQTREPVSVVVVDDESTDKKTSGALSQAHR
ncbi:MAG TPA: glycosyltransferase family 4 protein, partial [Blastocatellia bacterium]|nr:glycosyltransferase family 4 protein [Blastocatellia bacterium]